MLTIHAYLLNTYVFVRFFFGFLVSGLSERRRKFHGNLIGAILGPSTLCQRERPESLHREFLKQQRFKEKYQQFLGNII